MDIMLRVRDNPHRYKYHGAKINNVLPINLLEKVEYVIAVDPSTSATAMTIGNLVNDKADIFIELKRDIEFDDTEFNSEIYDLMSNFFRANLKSIKAVIVEKPFRHHQTTHSKFAKQRANFNLWKSMTSRFGLEFITCQPQSWRGTFTRKYGHLITVDKRKIPKTLIRSLYASNECIDLLQMSTDVSDSYGIFKYYLEKYKGEIKAAPEMEREYSHKITFTVVELKDLQASVQMYINNQKHSGRTVKPVNFEFCDELSLEDNIRCFTTDLTDKRFNIFVTTFFPSINNIRFLYKYRMNLPKKVTKETQLILLGYRHN